MNKVLALAISLLIFGYPIFTTLFLYFDFNTAAGNAAVKGSIVLLFLAVIMFSSTRSTIGIRAAAPLLIFFAIYAFRLLYDVMILDVVYFGQSKIYTLGYFFGLTFIPALAIALYLKKEDIGLLHNWMFYAAVIANVALMLYISNEGVLGSTDAFSGRFEVEGQLEGTAVLNPITVGIMGAILVAYTVGRLGSFSLASPAQQAFHGAMLVVGGTNVLVGASRGPALALAAALLMMLVLLLRSSSGAKGLKLGGKLWVYGGVGLAGLLYLVITRSETIFLFERFSMMFDPSAGRAFELRDVIYAQAWQDFLGAPVFGFSYMTSGGYSPHNLFLESLMATGVVGSVFLLPIIFNAARGTWRLLLGAVGPAGLSIGLAGICLFIVGLTSGSVGQFPEFWALLTIVTVLSAKNPARKAQAEAPLLRSPASRGKWS
jgi:hypothetical protein